MSTAHGALRSFTVDALKDQVALITGDSTLTLLVSDGFSERVVYWCQGRTFILSNGERAGPTVADLLVETGKLSAPQRDDLLQECRRSQTASLREVLLAKGILSAGEHDDLARKLVRDEIFDLVFWEDSLFVSYPVPPPPDFFSSETRLVAADFPAAQLTDVLHAWIERWLAVRPVLGSGLAQLRLESAGEEAGAEGTQSLAAGLSACRDGITFRDLWRRLDCEFPDFCDQVLGWIDARMVSVTPPVRSALTPERAIENLEQVLAGAVGKDLVRWKLANLYRKAKKLDKACFYYRLLHDEAAVRGDWGLALESLRSLLAVRPEDLDALRKLVAIQIDKRSARQAIATVFQAEQPLFKQGRAEDLKAIIEILGGIPGAQLQIEEVRADLKSVSGDHPGAVADYQSCARRYEQAGEVERAIQVLGKALEHDAENEELKRTLLRMKQRSQGPVRVEAQIQRAARALWLEAARRSLARILPRRLPRLPLPLPLIAGLLVIGGALFFVAKLPRGGSGDAEAATAGGVRAFPGTLHLEERVPASGESGGSRTAAGSAATSAPQVTASGRPNVSVKVVVVSETGKAESHSAPEGADPAQVTSSPQGGSLPQEQLSPADQPGVEDPPAEPDGDPRVMAQLFEDVLPRGPCLRHGLHTIVSRKAAGKTIAFAEGCSLKIEDAETGIVLLTAEAEEGSRWAYDAEGERAAAWKPGKPLALFTLLGEGAARTAWRLPPDTEAVAISAATVAVRQGDTTRLIHLAGGGEVKSAGIGPWDEGQFHGRRLLLAKGVRATGGEARPWVVDAERLQVVTPPGGDAEKNP